MFQRHEDEVIGWSPKSEERCAKKSSGLVSLSAAATVEYLPPDDGDASSGTQGFEGGLWRVDL